MQEIEIDLEEMKKNEDMLNESFLRMYGSIIQLVLKQMFGAPIFSSGSKIKGKPADIKAFARAIGGEKKYIEAVTRHGLNNPKTYRQKSVLPKATKAFEKTTGIKWPFK